MNTKSIFIFLVIMFLFACIQRYEVYGVCRHDATYALTVAGEKYPVRMTYGLWGTRGHNKAQAFKDGQWRWLCVDYPNVYFCSGDNGYVENSYYNPRVWLSKYASCLKS